MIQQYEHNDRIEQAVMYLFLPGTTDEDQEAREAARIALSALPIGASPRQFEQAKQNAIEPIRARIEARIQRQRDQEERQALMARIESRLPPDLSNTEKTTTLAKVAESRFRTPSRGVA